MKITAIPQIYRNLNRSIEILSVLSKYGLANWISRLDLELFKELLKNQEGIAIARHSPETRIRLALTELGPAFIKLGQVLSTRPDLIGLELAAELQLLQSNVPADPPATVRTILAAEFGRDVDEVFDAFDEQALASASIGQVHRARLHSGEEVVLKVQHHGIQEKIRVDLDILAGLAQLAERIPEFVNYRPVATVAEFRRTVLRELDFTRECRNLQQFAKGFAKDTNVHIPLAYPELTTNRVLTMEYLNGVKLADLRRTSAENGFNVEQIAINGANLYLKMIFRHGFYHADPHPGNILILDGGVIGLLDCGMVAHIDEHLQDDIEEMLMSVIERDSTQLTAIITRLGAVPPNLDHAGLSIDVADFIAHYSTQSLDKFDLSGALNELTQIIRRYHIMLPARIGMLLKVLVMLEGTSKLASPKFNLISIIEPYHRHLMLRRLSPKRQVRKLRRIFSEFQHLIEVLPRGMMDILEQVQSGQFDVHLDHRGLEPSVNRLVLGMLASALFLGSSLLLSHKVAPVIREVSVLGAMGALLSLAMGLRLLWAINKSGHLDRRK